MNEWARWRCAHGRSCVQGWPPVTGCLVHGCWDGRCSPPLGDVSVRLCGPLLLGELTLGALLAAADVGAGGGGDNQMSGRGVELSSARNERHWLDGSRHCSSSASSPAAPASPESARGFCIDQLALQLLPSQHGLLQGAKGTGRALEGGPRLERTESRDSLSRGRLQALRSPPRPL